MKTLVLFNFALNLTEKWSLFVELELAPLLWLVGVGYESPDYDAMVPCHRLSVNVPTFRLDFRLAQRADMAKARQAMEQLEAAAEA